MAPQTIYLLLRTSVDYLAQDTRLNRARLERVGSSKYVTHISHARLFYYFFIILVSRDGLVGVATCHEMDGPGIESRTRSSTIVRTVPGVDPASRKMGAGLFPVVKWPGRGVDHPPHLAPGPFIAYSRVTFTFTFNVSSDFISC
jgi:hypothetical protein